MLGYILNALDPATQRDVEKHLRDNPDAQRQLQLLRKAVEPLEADREEIDPPPGLALRALAKVAEYRCHQQLPKAPPVVVAGKVGPPERRRWQRADLLVAAVLLLAVLGIGLPKLLNLRTDSAAQAHIIACQDNLRGFHESLVSYSNMHDGRLPAVEDRPGRNVAGIFVPKLHEAGLLNEDVSVRCPANGQCQHSRWSLRDVDAWSNEEFDRRADHLAGCYAYTLGYRDQEGKLHGVRRQTHQPWSSQVPIMADRPAIVLDNASTTRANSSNHGNGQNVLFLDGHVKFFRHANVGWKGDHIYLNKHNQVKAGVDPLDTVLGASADRP
ncbi:MAG: H-X9-DG-CTERM domain-containing protein [Gemmataceae bacterium]